LGREERGNKSGPNQGKWTGIINVFLLGVGMLLCAPRLLLDANLVKKYEKTGDEG